MTDRPQLCREAIADPGGGLVEVCGTPYRNLDRYEDAHPPELVLALWECYEAAQGCPCYTCSCGESSYPPKHKKGCPVARVEELTND